MIDTLTLSIPKNQFIVFDWNKFKPLDNGSYVQNPTKEDKRNGIYKPALTIKPKQYGSMLRIQFSAPKLIYGNNLDEVGETDYEKVVNVLRDRLMEMGVRIFRLCLDKAPISNIHFCKNLVLSNYVSTSLIIKELSKINLNSQLDLNNTHFRNDGHAVYYYAQNHHIVFYDKIADIKKPLGRAVDKVKTIQQLSLFEKYKEEKRINEILRMEVRITHRQKLKSIFKDNNPTLEAMFKKTIAQKILLSYWKEIVENNIYIFKLSANEPKNILQTILNNHDITIKNTMNILGIKYFIEHHGIKTLKDTIKHRFTPESWYRYNSQIDKIISKTFSDNFIVKEFESMKKQLIEFKPYNFNNLTKI